MYYYCSRRKCDDFLFVYLQPLQPGIFAVQVFMSAGITQ
jgi:hypothetical protein